MAGELFMIVEHFRNRDAVPVYRRFSERGRMAPEGLTYVSSWVDRDFHRCYQVMKTEDRPCWTNGSNAGTISWNSKSSRS